jgi:hypothetical protein
MTLHPGNRSEFLQLSAYRSGSICPALATLNGNQNTYNTIGVGPSNALKIFYHF